MYVNPSPQLNNALQIDRTRSIAGKRVYQLWKGSNRFFLGGRLIFGPDVLSLAVTIFLIVVPMAIFCIYVARHLMDEFSHHAGVAIMVVAVVYTIGVLVLLLLTSGRDPGIIPRNTHPPEPEEGYDTSNSPSDWAGGQTPRLRLPRTKDVIVNGVAVKIKFCDTCMLYRPPRCSHCSICNNCVERFDHHCPWVGQCIGRRNYPFFFMFVSSSTILCIYVFSMSALHIKKLMEANTPHTVWKALQKSPASVFLMAYAFIAIWFVGGLTVFHLYLISTNQTTYENFRYRYDNKENPYDRGILQNFVEILWADIPPSKNKFRAKVQQEFSGNVANPQTRESGDVRNSNNRKASGDIELAGKPGWTSMVGGEGLQELHERKSNSSDVGMEVKEGYDDAFVHALDHQFPLEGGDMRSGAHPRRSSWGRKSGSWDMTPEIIALSTGIGEEGSHVNGDSTPPGNR